MLWVISISAAPIYDAEVDCVGLYCPMPISLTKEAIDNLQEGQILKVEADDPAAEEDISRWVKRTGHKLVKLEKKENLLIFYIKKMTGV